MTNTEYTAFCPDCASPLVDYAELSDDASCHACGWKGNKSSLLLSPFQHDMGSGAGGFSANVAGQFINDMRRLMGQEFARPFAQFLSKWGFLSVKGGATQKELAALVARYITAVARATVRVIIEERAQIEKEKVDGATRG